MLPCKAKMQYLFTLQVSRYCLLDWHRSVDNGDAGKKEKKLCLQVADNRPCYWRLFKAI